MSLYLISHPPVPNTLLSAFLHLYPPISLLYCSDGISEFCVRLFCFDEFVSDSTPTCTKYTIVSFLNNLHLFPLVFPYCIVLMEFLNFVYDFFWSKLSINLLFLLLLAANGLLDFFVEAF